MGHNPTFAFTFSDRDFPIESNVPSVAWLGLEERQEQPMPAIIGFFHE
ncbi:MAG: hypothetical protein BECKG1743F_GA0114225_105962 [Candidatus Kentron sp. G]|nr:MAG: hypothetical protein BECKG1743F_GA0114225_105962 [Candidatus Kentron sp. G]VFN03230.1 MAG: hypothetical protein BECKG1743E_GA0114224_105922 [Candidatus Kentron sp. G]